MTLTNSIWTFSPLPAFEFPKLSPASMTAFTWERSQSSDSSKLTKPGPATQTLPISSDSGRDSTIASPIALGFIRIGRANFMARLQEKSPFSAVRGLSMERSSMSAWGSSPEAWAESSAA